MVITRSREEVPNVDFLQEEKRVLLVDSNAQARVNMIRYLQRNIPQLDVVVAGTVAGCRAKFESTPFIVLSLVTARTPDATEAVRYLCQNSRDPVIGVGSAENERAPLRSAGCLDTCSYSVTRRKNAQFE